MSQTWTACPHCSLRHTARPDGLCPRCKEPVEAVEAARAGIDSPPGPAPAQAPNVWTGARPRAAEPSTPPGTLASFGRPLGTVSGGVTTAARIAGGVLIANALAAVAVKALAADAGTGPLSSPVSYTLDGVLGVMLLAGQPKALPWAKVRAALALLVLPVLLYVQGEALTAAVQVAYCGGLLALLIGTPRTPRLVGAGIGLAAWATVAAASLFSLATGRSLLPRSDVESGFVAQVEGRDYRYRLTMPNEHWRVRKAEAAAKDNAAADRWLVRTDQDAHVIVIAEVVPGSGGVEMEAFVNTVVGNTRDTWQQFKVLDRTTLATPVEGCLLHSEGVIAGMAVESYHGLFIRGRSIFQVWGFVEKRKFALIQDDLSRLITSFELVV